MNTLFSSSRRFMSLPRTIVCYLALSLLVLGACTQKKVIAPLAPQGTASQNLRAVEDAWQKGNMAESQRLAAFLLQQGTLQNSEKALAWEYLIKSAAQNGNVQEAQKQLVLWSDFELTQGRNAALSPAWRDAWSVTLSNLPRADYATLQALDVLNNSAYPTAFRAEAAMLIAARTGNEAERVDALQWLALLWNSASPVAEDIHGVTDNGQAGFVPQNSLAWQEKSELSVAGNAGNVNNTNVAGTAIEALGTERYSAEQRTMEARWYSLLEQSDEARLAAMASAISAQEESRFPYIYVLVAYSKRVQAEAENWFEAWQQLQIITANADVAGHELLQRELQSMQEARARVTASLALALPLTGNYSGITWDILYGVQAAQEEALRQGVLLTVHTVNTNAAGWEKELAALPLECRLVAGFVRAEDFASAERSGATAGRIVMTFLPRLPGGVEGQRAWRFFAKAEDQTDALLNLSVEHLGLRSFAVLRPNDAFGERLQNIFQEALAKRTLPVLQEAQYDAKKVRSWGESVRLFLGASNEKDALPPETPFEAVFLPEGWKNAELLLPYFLFHQEDRLVILGTSLWGAGMAGKNIRSLGNMTMAVYPDAWDAAMPSEEAQRLQKSMQEHGVGMPNLWSATGYDFVRLAQNLREKTSLLNPETTGRLVESEKVTAALRAVQNMPLSVAPIAWDENGMASQELFLFQVGRTGAVRVDEDRLARLVARVKEQRDIRVERMRLEKALEAFKETPEGEALLREAQNREEAMQEAQMGEAGTMDAQTMDAQTGETPVLLDPLATWRQEYETARAQEKADAARHAGYARLEKEVQYWQAHEALYQIMLENGGMDISAMLEQIAQNALEEEEIQKARSAELEGAQSGTFEDFSTLNGDAATGALQSPNVTDTTSATDIDAARRLADEIVQ